MNAKYIHVVDTIEYLNSDYSAYIYLLNFKMLNLVLIK